ncbi:MAG: dihydrolipoyl dehydrogenase [Halanaerobiales bacterium]|nr:dihydrolipoyl dehydrogenase [Halanaerobiales bacterium]
MKIAVIGGGPGGYVAAIKAAQLGAETILIEQKKVGGTCLNIGCIPTKALLTSTALYQAVQQAEQYGINITGEVKIDLNTINQRKEEIVGQLVRGVGFLLKKNGVKIIEGFGKITGRNTIAVSKAEHETEIITADKIIIATGSKPLVPDLFPYDGQKVITSDQALFLNEVPRSLLIVGGGVIGCEFGQYYQKIGTKVSIIEMLDQLLPNEDPDTASELSKQFKADGMECFTGTKVEKVDINNHVTAVLSSGDQITADLMLVAIGRKANISNIGLAELGIEVENGKIKVNQYMETSIAGIYAIGDVVDTPFLAHLASKEGTVAVENALGIKTTVNYQAVPRCVYTEPEVAAVGLTEKEAQAKGIKSKVGKFRMAGIGKALVIGKTQGFVKVITDNSGVIIGASIVGAHATDLLAELSLAVHFGLTAKQVGEVIHPHPTLSEALMEACHDVDQASVHAY